MGRRGPLQAAFTIKEFRELTKLPDVAGEVLPEHVQGINIQGEVIIFLHLFCSVWHLFSLLWFNFEQTQSKDANTKKYSIT